MAEALRYFVGFLVGLGVYRWCIGRAARSHDLAVTSRQLWTQTLAVIALPLGVALAIAWWIFQ